MSERPSEIQPPRERQGTEYQDIASISLRRVDDADSTNANVITIEADSSTSSDQDENQVREHLKNRNWWLQDNWREKELPREQVIVKTVSGDVELFNFGHDLTQEQLTQLQSILQTFAKIEDGAILTKNKYILIENNQPSNPFTGEDGYGAGANEEKAIKLYPRAMKSESFRIPTASNFEGTLIHELSHHISTDFLNDWRKTFGWRELDEPKPLPGGGQQYSEVENPSRCIDDYATVNPEEDICESMVAFLTNSEDLDPERKKFINDRISQDIETVAPVTLERKSGNDIILPQIAEPALYKVEKETMIIKRKPPKETP